MWIERKEGWLGRGGNGKGAPAQIRERVYTVAQVADIFRVTKKTVMAWIALDEPEAAVIAPEDWYRLPNGYIRIRERAVLRLQGGA